MRARITLVLVLGIFTRATPQPPDSLAPGLVSAQGNALALHDALEALIDERSDTPADREFAYTGILQAACPHYWSAPSRRRRGLQ